MQRYLRQIAIHEIGEKGQKKLCGSKVFITGCGALGSMVAMQLAGAGIGEIGIADFDTIDVSNLQRQFFFFNDDIGKSKTDILHQRIIQLNPEIKVNFHKELITKKNAERIFCNYDFIIDATDNPSSKLMIDEICLKLGLPCCIGGVSEFSGQIVTLVNKKLRYSELFQDIEESGLLPCSLGGVMGPAAGVCASIQAMETLKYLTGLNEQEKNTMIVFNLLKNDFHRFDLL